jgi:hypothetical protein
MSDWLLLALLAVGFYFYECCTWTPAAAFACYRKPFRIGWASASGAALVGNEAGGFAFSDPSTLSGNIIHCSTWPIAVSPDGVCLDDADAAQFWPFESIGAVSCYERTVKFEGRVVFHTASETLARTLARHLDDLRAAQPQQRAALIRASLNESFDADSLETTWSRFMTASRALTRLASLPLIWLAIVTPAVFYVAGPLRSWPYLLGGLLLTSLAVSTEFMRVHRIELPGASDRWLHAISMTLFPIAAIRAADRISKERLAHFSPALVTAAFCGEDDADAMLRRFGFDLQRATRHDDAAIEKCRDWYRNQQRAAFKRAMKALKRDPFEAPERIDQAMIAYCPRCHGQFGDGTECSDCDDVTLKGFGEAPEEAGRGKKSKRA